MATVWTAIKWLVTIGRALGTLFSSGLMQRIFEIVEEVESEPVSGTSKWGIVWDRLSGDERVREIIGEKREWIINLAIEAAVARLRG